MPLAQGSSLYNVFRHAKDALTKNHTDSVVGHPEMVRQTSATPRRTTALRLGPQFRKLRCPAIGKRRIAPCPLKHWISLVEDC